MGSMNYETIRVRHQPPVCFLQFHRPEAGNAINELLIEECRRALGECGESISVVVLEGLPEVFCLGADFGELRAKAARGDQREQDPAPLYDLWLELATRPFITVSHVRGKANAGGLGFVAASDIVLADHTAQFSLSELLFGLFPACVLPFLMRRIGFQRSHYMTLTTQPVPARQAHEWGLVDACDERSELLLSRHLRRLGLVSKTGIMRYKRYMNGLSDPLFRARSSALAANREIFSDPRNREGIFRYVEKGLLPWEQ